MHYQAMICSYSPTSGVFGDGRKPRVYNKLFYVFHTQKTEESQCKNKKQKPIHPKICLYTTCVDRI